MGYRSETENLRERVAELEQELGDAHDTIGRLTGLEAEEEEGVTRARSALLDAPRFLKTVRELELEVNDDGLEAIAHLIRSRTGQPVEQVGRTLTGGGLTLRTRDGRTIMAMTGDFSGLTAAAISGAALVGSFSGLVAFALVHDIFLRSLAEVHALWILPITVALAFIVSRKLARDAAEARAKEMRAIFEAACELASRHRVRKTRVRVEGTDHAASEEFEIEEGLGHRVAKLTTD